MSTNLTAKSDFLETIKRSWTWGRLTMNERVTFEAMLSTYDDAIKGTYDQRWRICQALYTTYLAGLGYTGGEWREKMAG